MQVNTVDIVGRLSSGLAGRQEESEKETKKGSKSHKHTQSIINSTQGKERRAEKEAMLIHTHY